jgi:hypothetical protein
LGKVFFGLFHEFRIQLFHRWLRVQHSLMNADEREEARAGN